MSTKTKNLSIYGSCVSRDTVEFCDSTAVILKRYIARQSLISTFSEPLGVELDLSALSSDFQKRMVLGDMERSFGAALPQIALDSDLLLWDLVDERLGVYQFEEGKIITRSLELITSGAEEFVKTQASYIAFGTDQHFQLWQSALNQFVGALDAADLRSRVRLLSVPWAVRDTKGRRIRPSMGLDTKKANHLYQRYFEAASHHVEKVTIGTDIEPKGSDSHKWGLAPFHYEDRVYLEIIDALELPI